MQPLDYLFEYLITAFIIFSIVSWWYNSIRVNRKTKDDLIERYVYLGRIKRGRQ